jgi:hypothetical protein
VNRKLKRSHLFALMVVLSFGLMMASDLPVVMFLGRVLILFSTLFHELGHALASLLVGGHIEKVTIQWDGSGVTHTYVPTGRVRQAVVSAGGLLGPSLAAAALFWSARGSDRRLRGMALLLGLGLTLIGLLAARSLWALIFTLGLGLALLLTAPRMRRDLLEAATVFIGVQLGLSVFTRADYLFTRWAGPNLPSDVANMASQLFLPFWFWGLVCGGLSGAVLGWGFRCYTRES